MVDLPRPAKESDQLWLDVEAAARFDPTVGIDRRAFPRMLRRYIAPAPHTEDLLFTRMLAGEPNLVTGFPAPLHGGLGDLPPETAGEAVIDWLARQRDPTKYRIFTGPTSKRYSLTLPRIAAKWRAGRTKFGVTDLHIRGTGMEKIIAPDVLSQFNLLPCASREIQEQEMFSFVISSRGRLTDSHSDAPDSSNFCFTGKKVWLAWDTYEGAKLGLQDLERAAVHGRARFDMDSWLTLPSARWCVVNPGQTLFLPAHLTHKVVTLDPYVGVGGFILALPNCLRLLRHWITRGPLWCKHQATGRRDQLLGEIACFVREAIVRIGRSPPAERRRWGYDYLECSARSFIESCPASTLRALWSDSRFRCVADVIPASWPLSSMRKADRLLGPAGSSPSQPSPPLIPGPMASRRKGNPGKLATSIIAL